MGQAEFERRFEECHAAFSGKYPHRVGWEPVWPDALAEIEAEKGIELADGFRSFLTTYGYGSFYFVTIFSPSKKSQGSFSTIWEYLTWDQFDGNFLPIASNGCELWTGYKVIDGKCSERLFNYDVDEVGYTAEEYDTIWSFLSEVALIRMG